MYLVLFIPFYAPCSMQPFYVHFSCALFPILVLWHWFISIKFHSIHLISYFSFYAYHYMHLIICISSYKSQHMHLCISTYIRVRKTKSKTNPYQRRLDIAQSTQGGKSKTTHLKQKCSQLQNTKATCSRIIVQDSYTNYCISNLYI